MGKSGKTWVNAPYVDVTGRNMLFRGRAQRSLDPKGRLMLPPEFRDILTSQSPDGRLVLTTYDECIVGLPLPEWQETEQRLSRMKNASRKVRDFRRLVLGGAEEATPDAQGRIRLTREQMVYAGIEQEAVLVGQGQSFEIWCPSRLEAVLSQDFDDVADEIAETGIDFGF